MSYRFKGFSRSAAKMLNLALSLAGQRGQRQVSTGHILLAILTQGGSPAANLLEARGVTQIKILGKVEQQPGGAPPAGQSAPGEDQLIQRADKRRAEDQIDWKSHPGMAGQRKQAGQPVIAKQQHQIHRAHDPGRGTEFVLQQFPQHLNTSRNSASTLMPFSSRIWSTEDWSTTWPWLMKITSSSTFSTSEIRWVERMTEASGL